jgi:bidirectional [NiFe] hydrogenase diaphorase subunit
MSTSTLGSPEAPVVDERFALLDRSLRKARFAQDQLIELLHVAQDLFGYLPDVVLTYLAEQLELPPARVYGVATFYHLFTLEPPGEHACTVCTGTACFVKGADDIVAAVASAFDLAPGATTDDGRLSLSTARCLGSCSLAPVVVVDGRVEPRQDATTAVDRVRGVLEAGAQGAAAQGAATGSDV